MEASRDGITAAGSASFDFFAKAIPTMKSYTVRVLAVILVFSLITNVLLFFRYSSSLPLVTVGSKVITKKQFQDQLEHDEGQATLTKLVFTSLVSQAAAHAGVMPTDADIDDRIQAIARQAPQVLAPYNQDPAKMAQFRQALATSMALENLRIRDVALSPAQIADFYARHKTDFGLPQQTITTTVVTQNAVDAATAADLLRQNDPPDVIGRQPRLRVVGIGGYNPDLQTLPPPLKQQTTDWAQKAGNGAVKTFQTGAFYLTFRVTGKRPSVIPPLSQVRGEVERAARLELAPSQPEELARLYQSAKPSFNSDKYAAYFTSVEQYPLGASSAKKTADVP
jgi:hypothetical protein